MTSDSILITDVSPRDGLQNLAPLSFEAKIHLIEGLIGAGVPRIEVGAVVSAKQLPAMIDSLQVAEYFCQRYPQPSSSRASHSDSMPSSSAPLFSMLVANLRGCEQALAAGIRHIAIFTAASDSFTQRNIHCSISESLQRLYPIIELAHKQGATVRGYVSCIVDCPYEGAISPLKSAAVAAELFAMGCDEISLGDTLGKAAPTQIERVLCEVLNNVPATALVGHYHNTYGLALANVVASFALGIRHFDCSAAGLGGCPFAPGASGNLATEELLWLSARQEWGTGIQLNTLIESNREWCLNYGITPDSRL
ncbi:hydroxymethylglutaryl-CoA lyase [Thaumasiovibrio subtropicus]|uniref:hydroxymethylglutaryl-CoA lyase n=1 Tax=Thaumasiovibrio subtropicus TaxID=1891207 RepID=UPI000B34C536|nr:hydroxymethylglutaryl-CoA lyase [Thaumasiovibrio subtropicus]